MTRGLRVAVWVALACAAGCEGTPDLGFGVAVTLVLDDTVGDSELAELASFEFRAGGDENFSQTVTLDHPARRTERIVYRPLNGTRQLTLAVAATAPARKPPTLATGSSGLLTLTPGVTTAVEIKLSRGAGDGGVAVDLGGGDLPSQGCPPNALCEPFEDVGLSQWSKDFTGVTAMVDGTRPRTGAASYHVLFPGVFKGGTVNATLNQEAPLPMTNATDGWVRAYVFAKTPLPLNKLDLFGFEQGGAPSASLGVLVTPQGKLEIYSDLVDPYLLMPTNATLPTDRWACVELHLTLGDPGKVEVYVDGTAAPMLAMTKTIVSPALSVTLLAGAVFNAEFDDTTDHEVWFDDLQASVARPGCP